MAENEVKLTITAEGKDAENALRKITARLNETGQAAEKVAEKTAKASTTISDKLSSINKVALGVQATIVSVGGVIAKTAVSWANACNDMSDATGMTAKSSAELLTVAAHVGIATGEMSQAMAIMERNAMTALQAQQAAAASGKESTDVFTQFGIAITDNNGKLLSAEQIFDNVAKKHREMADGVAKTAMEMQIFGRSGTKFNDMLNLSADKIDELKAKANALGLTISDDVAMKFRLAQRSVNDTELAFKAVAVQLGADMAPALKNVADLVAGLSTSYAQLDKSVKESIGDFAKAAAGVAGIASAMKLVISMADVLKAHPVIATLSTVGTGLAYLANMNADKYNAVNSKGQRLYQYQLDGDSDFGGEWVRTEAEDDGGAGSAESAAPNIPITAETITANATAYEQLNNAEQKVLTTQTKLNEQQSISTGLTQSVANSFGSAFISNLRNGEGVLKSLTGAFENFAQSFIQQCVEMYAKALLLQALTGIFGGGGAISGSSFGLGKIPDGAFSGGSILPKAGAGTISLMAEGGVVTAPTLAMVGEGASNEAVIPLNNDTFSNIAEGISNAGGGSVTFNVSAMDASGFADFLARGGLDKIKQALYDNDREFSGGAGVF